MLKVDQYIKRLVAFFLCALLYYLSINYLPFFISIPVLSITFSLLHYRITDKKPPYLFAFIRTEEYFKKGGMRDLLRILVSLLGFVYDVIIWTLWGVYLVFVLFIDLLDLLKSILFWIIHALIWIFRLYVPFVVFLYKIAIHYLIKWPWWLYQIAYNNVRFAYNSNSYRIALPGTLLAGLIIFLFYFLEIMLKDIPGITFIGIIIALLPITWSFGEIASIRAQKTHKETYREVKAKFQNGIEAVRSVLFYITLFVVLILIQIGLNLLGWIPNSGVPIGSFIFNINTFISLMLLFLCILIVMGVIIIPSYRIYKPFSELQLSHTGDLLKVILRKFLQYFTITVPSMVFSAIVMIIPFLIIAIVAYFSMFMKESIIEIKIGNLKSEQVATQDPVEADSYSKQIEHLTDLQQFPLNSSQDMKHREILSSEILFSLEDLKTENEEYLSFEENYEKRLDTIQAEIETRTANNPNDFNIDRLVNEKEKTQIQFESIKKAKRTEIENLNTHIRYLKMKRKQVPILFFFGGIWLVIFGGMVYSFVISYQGNVFHKVFVFRNNEGKSYWSDTIANIREHDPKQPLLGGTLFIMTVIVVYFLLTKTSWLAMNFSYLSDIINL